MNPVLEKTRMQVKWYFERHGITPPEKQPARKVKNRWKGLEISKRQQVFDSTGGVCWYCGIGLSMQKRVENRMTIDHVLPRSRGGSRELDNLVPACKGCNQGKADSPLEVFRKSAGIGVFWGENLGGY